MHPFVTHAWMPTGYIRTVCACAPTQKWKTDFCPAQIMWAVKNASCSRAKRMAPPGFKAAGRWLNENNRRYCRPDFYLRLELNAFSARATHNSALSDREIQYPVLPEHNAEKKWPSFFTALCDTGKRRNTFGWNAFADTNWRKNALSTPRNCSQVEIADTEWFHIPDKRILHVEWKNFTLEFYFISFFLLLEKLLKLFR